MVVISLNLTVVGEIGLQGTSLYVRIKCGNWFLNVNYLCWQLTGLKLATTYQNWLQYFMQVDVRLLIHTYVHIMEHEFIFIIRKRTLFEKWQTSILINFSFSFSNHVMRSIKNDQRMTTNEQHLLQLIKFLLIQYE